MKTGKAMSRVALTVIYLSSCVLIETARSQPNTNLSTSTTRVMRVQPATNPPAKPANAVAPTAPAKPAAAPVAAAPAATSVPTNAPEVTTNAPLSPDVTNTVAEAQSQTNAPAEAANTAAAEPATTNAEASTNVSNAPMVTLGEPPTNSVATNEVIEAPQYPVVNVDVDYTNPGVAIPTNFTGLSFEATQLLTNSSGIRYFRPDNKPLVKLFRSLGVKNLRIGGNTSDRDSRQLPTEKDLDSLFSFADAAGVKVIYCLKLYTDPRTEAQTLRYDIQTAKYIMSRYPRQIDCFSVGQEPSAYPAEKVDTRAQNERMGVANEKYQYTTYRTNWQKFANAIIAAVPNIKFAGPSVHNNGDWARRFMDDFGQSNHVTLITEHLYPGGAGGKIPSPEIGIDRMLAGDNTEEITNGFPRAYDRLYQSFVPLALSNEIPYRLEEVNNYFNGGATNVSNTFASALWGLDFMYWWAQHQAAGINFHTGDKVAAGASLQPSKYTAYNTADDGDGYHVRPLGYGIKAFQLGSHGKFLPTLVSNMDNVNVSVYPVKGEGKNLFVTVINKEHGTNGRTAEVLINLGETNRNYIRGEAIYLSSVSNDVTATTDITLGGTNIANDGTWKGTWVPTEDPTNGVYRLIVPPATAVVLSCLTANYDETRVGKFTLPDPLILRDGKPVLDLDDWKESARPEILRLYNGYIYGSSPKWHNLIDKLINVDGHALNNKAIRKQVNLEFYNYNQNSSNHVTLHLLLYTPKNASGKVPTFLCLSFSPNYTVTDDTNILVYPVWNRKTNVAEMPKVVNRGSASFWRVQDVLDRGYGMAFVDYNEIEPDLADGSGVKYGVRSLYTKVGVTNNVDDWGAISAWAWGASRILDYLQTDSDVDADHVILVGQSRLGKTALWAGAQDTRFAMVIASCSGEMGAALARRDYGETVTSMCKNYPYQFCRNFLDYSNDVDRMPVDSHMLLALLAPRPVFLNTGTEDRWSDPRGEFQAAIAASPVYHLYDKTGVVTNFMIGATNLPPNVSTNGSGPVLNSLVLERYDMPEPDVPIMNDIGFQVHTGKHEIKPEDWDRFLDFADFHFKGTPPHQYQTQTQ